MTLFNFCKAMAEWTADYILIPVFNFQAEDGIRDCLLSRGPRRCV